ncbi:MAG TPA: GGDEF domain-containing protein [Herbaspirillum sp.]|jgi:diguanylate cyclase (GGDEF)-like protein
MVKNASNPTETEYEDLFELAPVSLWLEDYSGLKRLFDEWRAGGVTDFEAHVGQRRDLIEACTAQLRVLKVNRRTLTLFAAKDQQQLVDNLHLVFRDEMMAHVTHELAQLWNGELHISNQTINYALDGRRMDIQLGIQIMPGHEADWSRVLVSLEDITARVQATRRLALSEQYARDLFEHSPVSLWVEDFSVVKKLMDEVRERGIVDFRTFLNVHPEFITRCMQEIQVYDVNQHTLRMFASPDKVTLFNRLGDVFRDEMQDSFAEQLSDLWNGMIAQQREVINYSLDGSLINIHMQFSVLAGHEQAWDLVLVSLVDITARKKAEAYMEYLGKHDTLTKLRNRTFYVEELNRLSRKGPWPLAILAIDLNGLKVVNDEQGHTAGDEMLRRAGEVLAESAEGTSCVARIGGDEFIILMPGADERAAQALKERILSVLELNNQFYPGQTLSMSMGMACCHAGHQLEACINAADRDMYREKVRYYEDLQLDRRMR